MVDIPRTLLYIVIIAIPIIGFALILKHFKNAEQESYAYKRNQELNRKLRSIQRGIDKQVRERSERTVEKRHNRRARSNDPNWTRHV